MWHAFAKHLKIVLKNNVLLNVPSLDLNMISDLVVVMVPVNSCHVLAKKPETLTKEP